MNNNSFDDYTNGLPSVLEFSSLHLTTALKAAVSALANTAGVYFIKCKLTGMVYIGSSMFLDERLKDHVLKSSNIHLRNAIDKYGLEAFVFGVVEFFEPHSDITREDNLSLLLAREQHWLDWLWLLPAGARYNFLPNAGSSLGVKLSKETRAKMSAAKKGKPLSPEHRNVFAGVGANNHRFGKTAPNAIKVYIYSLDGQLVNEHTSLQAAAEWLGVSATTISNYLNSGKHFKNLYMFRKTPV